MFYKLTRLVFMGHHRARCRNIVFLLAVGLLLSLSGPQPVHAATITVDEVTCTLIDAITAANTDTATGGCPAGSGADTIVLNADVTLTAVNNTMTGNNGLPLIESTILIQGNDHTIARVRWTSPAFRIFYVTETGNLTLEHVTVTLGSTSPGGGLYNNRGTVTIQGGAQIYHNYASNGGGIANEAGGTVTIQDGAIISRNSSGTNGGGIYNQGGTVTIQGGAQIDNNSVGNDGGGIHNEAGGTVTIQGGAIISGNHALSGGGGVSNDNGTVTIQGGAQITGNGAAVACGGGIHSSYYSTLIIREGVKISRNRAELSYDYEDFPSSGGGICAFGTVIIENGVQITNNSSKVTGGGILFGSYEGSGSSMIIRGPDTIISGNVSGQRGAGIYALGSLTIEDGVWIYGNRVEKWYFRPPSPVGGGGIYQEGGPLVITDSVITNNRAVTHVGGAILAKADSTVRITGSCIVGNGVVAVVGEAAVDATGNWWGAPSGPGPVGPGAGDTINTNVNYSGFLTAPPVGLNCPTLTDSLSGAVYLDANNNGILEAGEEGIAGVTITLTGTDGQGEVNRTAVTEVDGSYRFDVRPGTYTLTETQPAGYSDGIDTAGTLGGTVSNDMISGIVIAQGERGLGYNFGESGTETGTGITSADHARAQAPLCTDLSGTTSLIVRALVPAGTVTDGSVFCRVIIENGVTRQAENTSEIGASSVLERGVIQAVDVFGLKHDGTPEVHFSQPVKICLQGSGVFLYLDATLSPRPVSELPVSLEDGYTCASIANAGTVVLVSGSPSAAVPASSNEPATPLSGCMVTTRAILNLREGPGEDSAIIRLIPYNVTLTATQRQDEWFNVDYLGQPGWVSAHYVTPDGTCGP